jgi:hypothetical protein
MVGETCHIIVVSFGQHDAAYICNEEGKLIGCDINEMASQLFRHSYHDTIVGDVLVCNINEID